jgi:RND family efflux transporter MFP subunit
MLPATLRDPPVRVWHKLLWLSVCALTSLGCGGPAKPAEEKAPPATVKWQGPSLNNLEEWTELIGTTVPLPDRVARVTAPVEGRVLSVLGDAGAKPIVEGERVQAGAVLVQLDPSLIQANLAKAEASQEVLRQEERQAEYAVELAGSEVERLRKLKEEEDRRPPDQRTTLVSPVDRLKADYALKDTQSKLKAAKGRLAAGAKEEESLRTQLRLHTLSAPIAGRLGRIQVVRGQTLAVGTLVAELVDIEEQIDVLCFVPPSLVRRLKRGTAARTGGLESTAAEAMGEVEYIAEQAEPDTGNFAVKIRFSNKDTHLRANTVLRTCVLTQPGRECLSVPESAVREDEEQSTVVIVQDVKTKTNDDGKEETVGVARRLVAKLGVRDRTLHQVEITRLEDPEKDPAKKWQGDVKDALFVVEKGHGLQTGDAVKLDVEGD